MKALLSRWGRRWIAGLLAIAMLSGMIPTALASETPLDTTSESETELLLEAASETEAESVPETTAESVPETTAETVPETTAETVPETTAATVPETTAETESEEELSEEELEELLQLEGGEMALFSTRSSETVQDATPGISLNDAIEIAAKIAGEGKSSLDFSDNAVTVQSSADLILLSYVDPSEYCDRTINLSLVQEGIDYFDLVTPVEDTVEQTTAEETGTTATTVTKMRYSFQGLGGIDANPFAGTIATSSPKPIRTARALFNKLSTTATLPAESNALQFEILEQAVDGPVLAQNVEGVGKANWEIGLSGNASIGGIIGTMTGGTVTLEAVLSDCTKETDSGTTSQKTNLTCSGNPNAGFFCNTMTDGSLTATLSGTGSVSVTAESGSAGGFVGYMGNGCSLTASIGENAKITGVTAENGSAGGLVGTAVNSVVATQTGYTLSDITVTGKNAGGLIGSCTGWNNETNTIDLSKFAFTDSLTLSGDTAGGVFGALTNSGGTLTITTTAEGDKAITSTSTAATYGGLIGTYSASELSDTLEIKSLTVTSNRTGGSNYGGIIGALPTTCYVEMNDLTAKTSGVDGTFGGLVAEAGSTTSAVLLDVNGADVSVTSGGINGSVTGGLVGKLSKGVLRLDGTITVPAISAGEYKGRIVGENGDGLVYAVSTCALPTSGDASNIGNWGEVVRLGGPDLPNDTVEGSLFEFNSTAHTLTINNLAASDGKYTLNGTADFVGYALAYNYDENDVLKFAEDVNSKISQSVTLNGLVDLTGTGILGIGRDNGDSDPFTGTFDGGKCTITLDIGDTAGKLWARQRNNDVKSHGYLGLLAKVGNATISNLTLFGEVKMSVVDAADGNDDQKRNQALRAAGLAAYQSGNITCSNIICSANVTVDENSSSMVMVAGMVAQCSTNTPVTSTYTNCKWTSTLTNNRDNANDRVAGFLAQTNGQVTITVDGCELSGSITSASTTDARVGGLVADIEENSTNPSQITLKNLTVSATVSAANDGKNNYCGGLLGCHWYSTNVDFGGERVTGVTISGARLNAGSAKFGGLVYQATGHWDATANDSIKFAGTDGKETTIIGTTGDHRGLLVGDGLHDTPKKALYLEVGTWGGNGTAYWIDSSNVQLVDASGALLRGQFDELVGAAFYGKSDNKPASPGFYENNNAIISLTTKDTTEIDNGTRNTYTKQLTNEISNYQARYYYNLSNMSDAETAPSTLTTAQQVTTWSASQFAASNIRTILYAGANDPVTISNEGDTAIDLTHYSYYPVTPLNTVTVQNATLKFGFDVIEGVEAAYNEGAGNKKPSDSEHQHYLMQCGLLHNAKTNVTVENVILSGVVGKTTNGSGALIYGTVSGTSDSPTTVSLTRVTLSGLRVNGVDSNTTYAPLLINNAESYVNLTVDNLRTGTGYLETAADGTETTNTLTAATSLIGNVGSETATNLNLMFSNIALDSRIDARAATAVNNNEDANCQVEYNTTRSIFTKATLLNCFQYSADSSGIYNFYTYSNMVTYGVESSQSIQNEGEQYEYYDGGYICDGLKTKPADDTAAADYFDAGTYRPYVAEWKNQQNNRHELNVNKKPKNLFEGCGTYGDPYLIKDGKQLVTLAYYLNNATVSKADGFTVNFNTYVLGKQYDDGGDYHTLGGSANDLEYVFAYDENGGTWESGDGQISADDARTYLLNAYYQVIQEDGKQIIIKANDYVGLGTQANPFSGVIVGKGSPTVFLKVNNSGAQDFGGLIRYSRGSVVKDLAVDYSKAQITMTNGSVTNFTNNAFFGGVVGYCMGGDTIIDNVSVNYGQGSVALSGSYARMIAAGGYVGLVGGAKDSNGYEKTGGGVVFRNMDNAANSFATSQTNAGENSGYFYCNPYVGRVLDGYACVEGSELNNTNKNYKIPQLNSETEGLTVEQVSNASNEYRVTVTSAQGLWLLSAIVNSGAGAMDGTGRYTDVSGTVDAYQTGKPRSGDYDKIGTADGDSDLADEVYWGGIASESNSEEAKARVSYLLKKFTDATQDGTYHAARVCGGTSTANNPVALSFGNATIDMSSYGNGFRGIGGSYGYSRHNGIYYDPDWSYKNIMRRSIYASAVNGNNSTIKLAMSQKLYHSEAGEQKKETLSWPNQGAGLFVNFGLPAGGCTVRDLTINGIVEMKYCMDDGSTADVADSIFGESCAGGFAAKIPYNSNNCKLIFNGLHLGGDSEETKLAVCGAAAVGGALGAVAPFNTSVVFTNTTAQNITASTHISSAGNAGGLVGYFAPRNGGSCTVNSQGGSSKFENITITITGDASGWVAAGGLIAKCETKQFTIQDCEIANVTVNVSRSKQCGGLVGCAGGGGTIQDVIVSGMTVKTGKGTEGTGGLVGESQENDKDLTIKNVIIGTENAPVLVWNKRSDGEPNAGGLVGYLKDEKNAMKNATIQNCSADHLYVLSKKRSGGLVGYYKYNALSVSNVSLSNAIVATTDSGGSSGLVVGYSENKPTNGYNILADSCKVGYNSALTGDTLVGSTLEEKNYTARWVGRSGSGATSFVAVAVNGGALPDKDVVGTGTVKVIYADFPADTTNWPGNGSASPYVDVNPKIDVTVKESANSTTATTLTGNGVGYHTVTNTTTDAEGQETTTFTHQSVAKTILEEVTKPNKRYFNLVDGDRKTFSKFLNKEEAAYLTTYQAEEGATTTAKNVDFPILVLASNANADTVLWTYIAALTNVSSGTVAKDQASGVTATTYKWNGSDFVKHTSSSLTVNDKKISTVKNQYDNQDSRFTLLDVKYKNPTTTTTNAAGDYFHLYVPVLVKKVLRVKYTIKILAGTNYYADGYSGAAYYATANFNEPVTALIGYRYERTPEEWNEALNNGEDLLWHYKKVFDLKSNGTNLPMGTRLTLVDVATGKAYFYTMQGDENNNYFDCEDKLGFSPLPICDYLEISVSETGETTAFVATASENGATVKVGDTHYRPATTDEKSDSNIEKRYLTVGGIKPERYFLTIQVPEAGITFINNLLDLPGSAMVRVGNAPPAVNEGTSNGRYVLYNGVAQSNFTIKTERVGGSGTEMTSGDAIRVQLSSDLYLTEEGRKWYDERFRPVDLNHRFTIDLKKVVGTNTTDSILGATGISWNYTVVDKNDRVLGTSDWCTYTPGELDAFSVSSGSYFKKGTMVEWIDEHESLTVKAEIILQYGNNVGSVFPARTGENSSDGSYVHAESRVANAESQLPITANKLKKDGAELYYCVTPSSASLTFDAIEPSGGEKTLQLGINSDDDYQPRIIQTDSIYDYSEVDPVTVSKAKYVRYTLELFQKQGNGLYNGDAVSPINDYLPIVRKAGVSRVEDTDQTKMTWTKLLDEGATCDSTSFDFVPLTGAAFEEKGFTYANYMIRLTAELLEEKQDNGTIVKEVLPGTLASDYIVYTNARVLQKIPDDTNS